MRFASQVELGGKTATGIEVPESVVVALGSGKRPAVRVTVGGHSYRTTVAPMSGRYFVPLNAENRAAAGVAAGDAVDVEIELDTDARELVLPDDLNAALRDDEAAGAFFAQLSYTHRKEWARWIEEARKPDTRAARLEKTLAALS